MNILTTTPNDIANGVAMSLHCNEKLGNQHQESLHWSKAVGCPQQEQQTKQSSNDRLHRLDVYDPSYCMDAQERNELRDLAADLGFLDKNHHPCQTHQVLSPETFSATGHALRRLFAAGSSVESIVLKRGTIQHHKVQHELILLTHGFVLARVEHPYWNRDSTRRPLVFVQCELYENIKYTQVVGDTIRVHLSGGAPLSFGCDSVQEQQAWWSALSMVLVKTQQYGSNANVTGWRQRLLRESNGSGSSVMVMGKDCMKRFMNELASEKLGIVMKQKSRNFAGKAA